MSVQDAIKIIRCINNNEFDKARGILDEASELNETLSNHLRAYCSRTMGDTEYVPVFIDSKEESIEGVLHLLMEERYKEAFNLVVKVKAKKSNEENVDFLRAILFIILDQEYGYLHAYQSILEELRHHPKNTEALSLMEEVKAKLSDDTKEEMDRLQAPQEFRDWYNQIRGYSMLPIIRLYNLYILAKEVCQQNVPGNFVECGVAGGGSTALLAMVVQKYSTTPRTIYACDSYEGMPEPSAEDMLQGVGANDTGWGAGTCAAPEESLQEICTSQGVSQLVKPVKGWFDDTLPSLKSKAGPIAFMHVDCDWYESTLCVFDNLYDLVHMGCPIQVDDYGYWEGMRKALDEFFVSRSLTPDVKTIDGMSAWFVKV